MAVCYEYLEGIYKNVPTGKLHRGVTEQDAILGSLLDVFLHETGQAVFDLLEVPVLGREEDAADMFSTYIMLQFGKEDARRLILGTAYQYRANVAGPWAPKTVTDFANEHELPAQRFFNLLCFAYGDDRRLFADLAKDLPKERADGCDVEYEQSAFAFRKLIGPYMDKKLAKKVFATLPQDMNAPPPSGAGVDRSVRRTAR